MIRFEVPFTLPTLNTMLREGRHRRKGNRDRLAWAVIAAIGLQRPQEPFRRARVRIERHGLGAVDQDNLTGSAKSMLDVLQPMSKRHPAGLGVITDDSTAGITLEVVAVRVRHRADQKTVVIIEEIPT